MPFVIIVTREAEIDLDENFIWYEEQKDNLGSEFIQQFDKVVQNILINPFYASVIEDDARGASLKRFPYLVVYRIIEATQQIRIIAVIHQHRNPTWISSRIK